ncbi:MAG TPA: sigma 54-interacting transcriptional regulator, partial [Negativicutes bacterium]|nr:sigma 54-interacting transcriptional regulator [Negativicutes bacterium]
MLTHIGDITDKNLLELIINQLNSVVLTDERGRYVYVNKKWTELMDGLTLEDVRGLYVRDVVPDTKLDVALRTGKVVTGDSVRMKNHRGEQLQLFCTYVPLYDEERIIGCIIHAIVNSMHEAMTFSANMSSILNELTYYREELKKIRGAKYSIANIIGVSTSIKSMKAHIYQSARSVSTVLIEGETGCGKELVAHSIHALSNRSAKPFIKVNCAAIPHELLESEFFGYEYGAFTGAQKNGKKGKFELADEGTLFLDEINQLPLMLQPKLLRVLQEKEIEHVGGKDSVPVDFRLIAASNVSLEELVRRGKFRQDLFYRLNVIRIEVPPLRKRKEDIPYIADSLLERLNFQMGMKVPGITGEAKKRLMEYNWPGNVRELQNVIERAMNEAWCETLSWQHFEDYFANKPRQRNLGWEGNLR